MKSDAPAKTAAPKEPALPQVAEAMSNTEQASAQATNGAPQSFTLGDVAFTLAGNFQVTHTRTNELVLDNAAADTNVTFKLLDLSSSFDSLVNDRGDRTDFRLTSRLAGSFVVRESSWQTLDLQSEGTIWKWRYVWRAEIELPKERYLYVDAKSSLGPEQTDTPNISVPMPAALDLLKHSLVDSLTYKGTSLAQIKGGEPPARVTWRPITAHDATDDNCGFPEPRYGAALFEFKGALYLFGGANRNLSSHVTERFNDLWRFNVSTDCWQKLILDGELPEGGAMLGTPLETAPGKWVVTPGIHTSNRMWQLDVERLTISELSTKSVPPSPRYGFATFYRDARIFWLNGEKSWGTGRENPLFSYRLKTGTWQTEHVPAYVSNYAFWNFCTQKGDIHFCLDNRSASVTVLNWADRVWYRTDASGPSPLPGSYFAPVETDNTIYVFGGIVGTSHSATALSGDLWMYRMQFKDWRPVLPTGAAPEHRYYGSAVMTGNRYWLFGGRAGDGRSYGDFFVGVITRPQAP